MQREGNTTTAAAGESKARPGSCSLERQSKLKARANRALAPSGLPLMALLPTAVPEGSEVKKRNDMERERDCCGSLRLGWPKMKDSSLRMQLVILKCVFDSNHLIIIKKLKRLPLLLIK